MIHDIVGEWELVLGEKGAGSSAGGLVFLERDGRVVVKHADPELTVISRVALDGDTVRFELLSPGSSRGNAHDNYELRLHGPDEFGGTRRRGLLTRIPIVGRRVDAAPAAGAAPTEPETVSARLAEAQARAAAAAERASLAAAEAAAALAEVEAAAALAVARRAAENAAAARAAVPKPAAAEVLATLPAPQQPPAFVPMAPVTPAPVASEPAAAAGAPVAKGRQLLRITHRLTHGDSAVLAAEAFPGVYVWGGTFAAPEARLREAGWEVAEFDTEESTEIDELLIRHAAMIRDAVAS